MDIDEKILQGNKKAKICPYMYKDETCIPNINQVKREDLKRFGWCNFNAILCKSNVNPYEYGDENFWTARFIHNVQLQLTSIGQYNCQALCLFMEPLLDERLTYNDVFTQAIQENRIDVIAAMMNDMDRTYDIDLINIARKLLQTGNEDDIIKRARAHSPVNIRKIPKWAKIKERIDLRFCPWSILCHILSNTIIVKPENYNNEDFYSTGKQKFWEWRFDYHVQIENIMVDYKSLCLFMEPLFAKSMTYNQVFTQAIHENRRDVIEVMVNDESRIYDQELMNCI